MVRFERFSWSAKWRNTRTFVCSWVAVFLSTNAAISQDRTEVMSKGRTYMETLCSPAFHGRGYVSGGDSLAAEWVANEFHRIGLKPVDRDYFEPFEFNVNTFPDSVKVSIDGKRMTPGVDFILDPASGSISGVFSLIHITLTDLLDPERQTTVLRSIAGNAAVLHFDKTTNSDTLRLQAALKRDLMQICPVIIPVYGKLTWGVAQEAMPYPLIEIIAEKAPRNATSIELDVRNTMRYKHQARNIIGMVPGHTDQWVMVTAHYDHLGEMGPDALFPGANDNASGVAMLLSLAEWFKSHPPKHNILFVAFAGEEAGLMGSEWCAANSPIDLSSVKLVVNLDILGTGDDGIMVVNATAEKKHFNKLVKVNRKGKYLPQVKARGPACNSDHCPFVKRGVPGIFIYTLGGIAAYHDVFDKAGTLPLTKFPEVYALLKEFIPKIR